MSKLCILLVQELDRAGSTTAVVNGFTRHAGTADYASDGEEAAKRVKVVPPPAPPPPPPPATPAAPEPPPRDESSAVPVNAAAIEPGDSRQLNGHVHEALPSSYLLPPPGLGEPSAAAAGYDPFSGGADLAEAMDIDSLPPGIGDGFRSTSLSHYVPLEPLPPPPMPSPSGQLTPPAAVTAIAANPGFGGAGRRPAAGPAAANGHAEAAPVQPTDLVPADVDTLLRCAGGYRPKGCLLGAIHAPGS